MESRTADRTWLLVGLAGIVAILGLGWVLLVGPATSALADQRAQTENAELDLDRQQTRLAQLRSQNNQLAQFQAELAGAQEALPANAAQPEFLRALQSMGTATGVTIDNLAISDPAPAKQPGVVTLPITMSVTGPTADTEAFLNRLQAAGRAVLVGQVNSTVQGSRTSMTLSLQAFVSQAGG
ncbi:hypothetical protein GCM10010124_21630 [Pilimelia terevasa]|uniref:Type IV pilus biogenesis protein PilO n=1 Tax=Pilimelia terevasa TaxID=53372 RepID=A0A8J3FJD0_9ACTN|nr:type 4a pilus biogenesis protein PilO [Pilimelia terevasa]GGK28596.1 hypothetical protein GCM10010124_21630 [Pilimelia terevasa]